MLTARNLAKHATKTIIMYATQKLVTDAVRKQLPSSQAVMAPEIIGSISGYVVSEKLAPTTDKLVDAAADKLAARRNTTD